MLFAVNDNRVHAFFFPAEEATDLIYKDPALLLSCWQANENPFVRILKHESVEAQNR